jgi:SAM-dependent methyltransferase
MLAELLARSGSSLLNGIPPNGKDYWAARFWDRDSAEKHPVLSEDFLVQKETIGGFLEKYGADANQLLEFCCGTGEFTRIASERTSVREITALDISAQGLALARERVGHNNLNLVEGDFWKDNGLRPADLVMCIDAIHHLGDLPQVLRRIKSFMAPGAVFVGNLWTGDNFHDFERRRYGRVEHLRRTMSFFGTAMLIRVSGGKLKTGAYRTQLRPSDESLALLREIFSEVVAVEKQRYFMGFVCRA